MVPFREPERSVLQYVSTGSLEKVPFADRLQPNSYRVAL